MPSLRGCRQEGHHQNKCGASDAGRIIDFNERTMRHFDPSLRLGLIVGVKITPLPDDAWTPGPIDRRRERLL
jgi:hypothetical protein